MAESSGTGGVVHCKKEPYDVYIGRPSVFGNPFSIGKDGDRREVIDKYRKYLKTRMSKDCDFQKRVFALKGKVLGCWCSPSPCHGDVIIEEISYGW